MVKSSTTLYFVTRFECLYNPFFYFSFQNECITDQPTVDNPSSTMALLHSPRLETTRNSATNPCRSITSVTHHHSMLTASQPPAIAISRDGEERRYPTNLTSVTCPNLDNEKVIRPPPNRTVYDGESPPSYRSKSFGSRPESVSHSVRSCSSSSRRSPHRISLGATAFLPAYRPRSVSDNNILTTGSGPPPDYNSVITDTTRRTQYQPCLNTQHGLPS